MPRADRARAGAYGAAVCAAAYGSMKLAQALGANALADKDPLPPHLREQLLARHPLFVASHWLLAGAAAVGVIVTLASVRPWGARFPRRLLLAVSWTLGIFMIARAVGTPASGLVGDALLLTGVREAPAGHSELAHTLARWDLLLWSPFFLVWGMCWTVTGWRLGRVGRERGLDSVEGRLSTPSRSRKEAAELTWRYGRDSFLGGREGRHRCRADERDPPL